MRSLVLICCFVLLPLAKAKNVHIDSSKRCLIGIDISQFMYNTSKHKSGLNIGICSQYKIFNQFSAIGSFYFNDVSDSRGRGYNGLSNYQSIGYQIKIGVQTGFKLKGNSEKRSSLVVGINYGHVKFRESGNLNISSQYWGDYSGKFKTPIKAIDATEFCMGYQFEKRAISIKFLYYAMFNATNNKQIIDHSIAEGYRSIFVPGYGFKKNGINLIVYWNIFNSTKR